MRLDEEKPSTNIEDRRGDGGGFSFPGGGGGFPGGGGFRIPIGGGRGGFGGIALLIAIYLIAKIVFGVDLLSVINGGGGGIPMPGGNSQFQVPGGNTDVTGAGNTGGGVTNADVTTDAGKDFVARVLGSTERVWGEIFQKMGQRYEDPKLVLFSSYVQSACGMAQSAMGPFYCPNDRKVYIDLSFYQDLKTKLGAPGDFAQAYVVAHEVGHHVQNLWGIADKVNAARAKASDEDSNALSVRMELQADCLAGVWAKEADATKHILEQGDVEEALNAASQIGDDRLQKKSQGYVVPESFTHGTSAQRVKWFKTGLGASDVRACDTFSAQDL
jgi:uncharacterized protein